MGGLVSEDMESGGEVFDLDGDVCGGGVDLGRGWCEWEEGFVSGASALGLPVEPRSGLEGGLIKLLKEWEVVGGSPTPENVRAAVLF